MWIVLAVLSALIIIPVYNSINEADMMVVEEFALIVFAIGLYKVARGGIWLVMNQDNKLAMWLASQTGYAPVKVSMFINNVLISRYEARLTAMHKAENTDVE